jgi:hypothetical protein
MLPSMLPFHTRYCYTPVDLPSPLFQVVQVALEGTEW